MPEKLTEDFIISKEELLRIVEFIQQRRTLQAIRMLENLKPLKKQEEKNANKK